MAQFATAGHLACWIEVCPGMNESAGVNKSGRTRQGSNHKRVLGVAAMAAIRNKDCYLSAYYRRVATWRGRRRAQVAVIHKTAIAIWHILRNKTTDQDLGADYFTRRDPERAIRRMTKEANRLGLTVRLRLRPHSLTRTHSIFRVSVTHSRSMPQQPDTLGGESVHLIELSLLGSPASAQADL
ncbi:transposase [Streptomyces sp. NPDC004232]|uniref:transposase n=1 Tax=Streptomyces sp. NPDC004232 TaxID=3154454 RepID=UPI0033AD4918